MFVGSTPRYSARMIDENTRIAILVEAHAAIKNSATAAVTALGIPDEEFAVRYPPNESLTSAERDALRNLRLSDEARSGLLKVIRDCSSQAFFHFFSIMDGVTDPPQFLNERKIFDKVWVGVALKPKGEEHEEMLHDAFYETYWDFKPPGRE